MASLWQRIHHCFVNFDRRWLPTPRWEHYFAREKTFITPTRVVAAIAIGIFQWMHKVATNIAYYLHTPRETLTDVGYSVLPPLSPSNQILSEILFFALAIGTGVFAFGGPLCYPRRGFYTCMMVIRYTTVLVIAQALRILSFLVTSLPGPNYHCRPNSPDYNPPLTSEEIISRPDPFKGCGDLVFSSHTIFVTLCVLVFHKYSAHQNLRRMMYGLLVVFGLFVISARKHYTVDIIVAWYVVILTWIGLDHYYPDSLPPALAALEDQYERDTQNDQHHRLLGLDFAAADKSGQPNTTDSGSGGSGSGSGGANGSNVSTTAGGGGSGEPISAPPSNNAASPEVGVSAPGSGVVSAAAVTTVIVERHEMVMDDPNCPTLEPLQSFTGGDANSAPNSSNSALPSGPNSAANSPPVSTHPNHNMPGSSILRQAARDLELGIPESPAVGPTAAPTVIVQTRFTTAMPLIDLSTKR